MTTILVSAMYPSFEQAKQAVSALESTDIDTDNVSIIASNGEKKYDSYAKEVGEDAGTGAGVGAAVGAAGGLLAGLGLMAVPGAGPVVAAGWLASTLTGAVGGAAVGAATGGLIGALTESGMDEDEANLYAEHVRQGGAIVCVRVDDDNAGEVNEVLQSFGPLDPDVQRTFYSEEGWTSFSSSAKPLTADQIRETRTRYSSRY